MLLSDMMKKSNNLTITSLFPFKKKAYLEAVFFAFYEI